MSKEAKKFLLPLVALTAVAGFAYYNFLSYAPKALKPINEVKGYRTQEEQEWDLPYPEGSKKIGVNTTSSSTQTTIETAKTPEEVYLFYKNILVEKGWDLDSEGLHENYQVAKFKKDDKLITVISSRQDDADTTIASIEISDRQ